MFTALAQQISGHIQKGVGAQIMREAHKDQLASARMANQMTVLMSIMELKMEQERQAAVREAMNNRLREIDESYGKVDTPKGRKGRAAVRAMIDRMAEDEVAQQVMAGRQAAEGAGRAGRMSDVSAGRRGGSTKKRREEAVGTGMAAMTAGAAEQRADAEHRAGMGFEAQRMKQREMAMAPVNVPLITGSPALDQFMRVSEAANQLPWQQLEQGWAGAGTAAKDVIGQIGQGGASYEQAARATEMKRQEAEQAERQRQERQAVLREAGYV